VEGIFADRVAQTDLHQSVPFNQPQLNTVVACLLVIAYHCNVVLQYSYTETVNRTQLYRYKLAARFNEHVDVVK
jgi:hypothetical protein